MTARLQLVAGGLPAPIVGVSPAMQRARDLVARYAVTNLPVLLMGPTGTGKELLAQHLHAASGRRGRLVPVNCGALPEHMAESLMFGHRRGAFSGAVESRRGYWEHANDGTLFLDELLSLAPALQPKMLRALDSGEVVPLGDEAPRYARVRVVAAAHDDIQTRVKDGSLRPDLYHRVAAVRIDLPPLVARIEDVAPLAEHFAAERGCTIAAGGALLLGRHAWPGNVRELRFVVERAVAASQDTVVRADALVEAIDASLDRPVSNPSPDPGRRERLAAVCRKHGGDRRAIARELRISQATLYRRLREYGILLRDPVEGHSHHSHGFSRDSQGR